MLADASPQGHVTRQLVHVIGIFFSETRSLIFILAMVQNVCGNEHETESQITITFTWDVIISCKRDIHLDLDFKSISFTILTLDGGLDGRCLLLLPQCTAMENSA